MVVETLPSTDAIRVPFDRNARVSIINDADLEVRIHMDEQHEAEGAQAKDGEEEDGPRQVKMHVKKEQKNQLHHHKH